jgi:hypothetical protein
VLHDRAELPDVVQPTVRDVILIASDGKEVTEAITEANIRVRTFHAAGPALDMSSIEDVVAALRSETHEHVVVVATEDGGFEVIPLV